MFGHALGPAVGMVQASQEQLPPDASVGERIANTIGGALKEADDMAVSGAAGTVAAWGQRFGGVALSVTGAGAPVGVGLIATVPITATTTSVAVSAHYDNSGADKALDSMVENIAEPVITMMVDSAVGVAEKIGDARSQGVDWVNNLINDR